jgi:membrane-associated phospholipid phosphatase
MQDSVFTRGAPASSQRLGWTAIAANCRGYELLLITWFSCAALLTWFAGISSAHLLGAAITPVALYIAAAAETQYGRRWSGIFRDWIVLALIPVAYWEVGWFDSPPLIHLQQIWIGWDHALLVTFGLQAAIESLGPVLPACLEFIYLCLYAIPPLCLGAVYYWGRRQRANRFLSVLFLGTLTVYALLPLIPTVGPRFAFPGHDLPHFFSIWRSANLYVLDHLDISTSVFPSGHVAVAFSSALGLLRAVPEKRWLGFSAIAIAFAVFVATIYCRYHYAVDGLASIAIALAAWRLEGMLSDR